MTAKPRTSRAVSVEPRSPATVEKRTNSGVRLPASAKMEARVSLRQGFVTLEIPMGARTTRMHDALRDPLMIEVGNLLAQDEVFKQRGAAQTRLERILIIRDGDSLIGGQCAPARIDTNAV